MKQSNIKRKGKLYCRALFLLYIAVIIKLIIFKYPAAALLETSHGWGVDLLKIGIRSANFVPFKTIKMYIHYYSRLNSFENLFGNILVFIPFAVLAPLSYDKLQKAFIFLPLSLLFITGIEVFQLLTRFGEFDVDDILLNFTGVIIGWLLYKIILTKK